MDDQNKPQAPQDDNTPSDENGTSPQQNSSNDFVSEHQSTVSTDSTSPEPSTEPSSSNQPLTDQPQPTVITGGPKRSKRGLLAFIFILLILAAGAGYYYLHNKTTTKVAIVTKKYDIADLQVADFSGDPAKFYPDIDNNGDQFGINMQAFEALTKFVNLTTLKPGLSTGWTNPDQSTWIFKLQPNVHFHTGKLMTATDVKASIDYAMTTDYGKNYTSTIKTVTVVDPNTVKIETVSPDPILANELSAVFIFDSTSGKKDDTINGTGPYTLKSASDKGIVLTAVDSYWGGHVYTRQLTYLPYTQTSDIPKSVITNKTLGVSVDNNDPAYRAALLAQGYKSTTVASYSVNMLVLNSLNTASPLANVKVRQALAPAIDVQSFAKARNSVGATTASQVIAAGIPGYNPSIQSTEYSVAKAKAALADAGYPNGFTVKLTYNAAAQKSMDTIIASLAAIGVKVTQDPQTDQSTFAQTAFGGKTDMFYITLSSSYEDGSDILAFFHDTGFYHSDTFEKQYQQANQTFNQTKRIATMQSASKTLMDDQAILPLQELPGNVMLYRPEIVYNADSNVPTLGAYFWNVYATKP